jgi:hypothetical protein
VRYAISFAAPLRNHRDTRSCFFDLKEDRWDIRESVASGRLCDECLAKLRALTNGETYRALEALSLTLR